MPSLPGQRRHFHVILYVAPLKLVEAYKADAAAANFHVILYVAPLKLLRVFLNELLLMRFPRHFVRGPIEA